MTKEEARNAGRSWAYENEANPDQFEAFALTLQRKHGDTLTASALAAYCKGFFEAKTAVQNDWDGYGAQEWKLRDDWILETVKHLALVNAAGLAGATAALSRSTATFHIVIAVCVFGFGLLLAVLDLYTNAYAHYSNGLRANEMREKARSSESWDDLVERATAIRTSETGKICSECATIAGAFSALCALAGVIFLVVGLI